MVNPEIMYLWKKGYAQAIGTTINTTSAIRKLSDGNFVASLDASAPNIAALLG